MSEQGADKAGLQISMGIKFFFTACGIGIATALFLWLMPDFIKAIAETILMFKSWFLTGGIIGALSYEMYELFRNWRIHWPEKSGLPKI